MILFYDLLKRAEQHFVRAELAQALSIFQDALRLEPNNFLAWEGIAKTLVRAKEFSQAQVCYTRLLEMHPLSCEYLIALGKCLVQLNQIQEGASHFARVLKIESNHPVAVVLLGDAFLRLGQLQSALSCFRLAVKIEPESAANWYNLGMVLSLLHLPDQAENNYRLCLNKDPDHSMALNNFALSQLVQGKLRSGFDAYRYRAEVRLKSPLASFNFKAKDLKGRPLLLLADQGLGDQIFFLRFLQYLPALGIKEVTFAGDARLEFLIPELLPVGITLLKKKPKGAIEIYIADLPYFLGFFETMLLPEIRPLSIKQNKPVKPKRRRLGITWRAGIRNSHKEISLLNLLDCLEGLDIVPVVLQRNPTQDELALIQTKFPNLIDASALNENLPELVEMLSTLAGMAGVSNTNFYLGAHVGLRSYFLIKSPPDFRFGHSSSVSPWFPNGFVYRQGVDGSWDEALIKLREQLLNDFGSMGQTPNELALRLMHNRQMDEALDCLRSEGDFADPAVMNLLGQIYREMAKYTESLRHLRMAEKKLPEHPVIVNSLAQTLFKMEDMSCLSMLKQFVSSQPVLRLNLVGMLNELGRYSEALAYCEEALSKNYIVAAFHLGEYKKAFDAAKQALMFPMSQDERLELTDHLSVLASLCQDYPLAWSTYRARPSARAVYRGLEFSLPDRSDLLGKSVWIAFEQGLGDELFFLRWIPRLYEMGVKRVAYAPSLGLRPLLESQSELGFELIPFQTMEPDICLMAGDLPEVSQAFRDDSLCPVKLVADRKICNKLLEELSSYPRPYIGITYRAGIHSGDKVSRSLFKSIDSEKLGLSLRGISGTFILLQRHPTPEEINGLERGLNRQVLRHENLNQDLVSMLCMLSILDEYICVSNTNLYLRESLGLMSRVLIPHPPEFRWGQDEKSPWVHNTKIYRQNHKKIWDNCLDFLRRDLEVQNV